MKIKEIKTSHDLKLFLLEIFEYDENDILAVEKIEILIKEGSDSLLMKLEDDDSIIEEYINNVPVTFNEILEVIENAIY